MTRTASTAVRSTTRFGVRVQAGLAAGALLTGLAAGVVAAAPASATPSGDVTLCHATHARSNPYVVITVDTSSVDEIENLVHNGHGDHVGPVFDPADDAQKEWGDIIPSFLNPDGSVYPGLNAEAGAEFLAAGCEVPEPAEPADDPTEPADEPTEPVGTPTEPADDPTQPADEPSGPTGPTEPTEPAGTPATSEPEAGATTPVVDEPQEPQLATTGADARPGPLAAAALGLIGAGALAMRAGRRGTHV